MYVIHVIAETGTVSNREPSCNFGCRKQKMQRECGKRDFEWPLKSFLLCTGSLLPAIHYFLEESADIQHLCQYYGIFKALCSFLDWTDRSPITTWWESWRGGGWVVVQVAKHHPNRTCFCEKAFGSVCWKLFKIRRRSFTKRSCCSCRSKQNRGGIETNPPNRATLGAMYVYSWNKNRETIMPDIRITLVLYSVMGWTLEVAKADRETGWRSVCWNVRLSKGPADVSSPLCCAGEGCSLRRSQLSPSQQRRGWSCGLRVDAATHFLR